MKIYNLDEVADTLLALARGENIPVSNLKLQKLIFYAQAWSLVFYKTPLFREDFEAWVHGPVVPSLFRRFRHYGWKPIEASVPPVKGESLRVHLGKILKAYGHFAANDLERLSHSEDPWKDARVGLAPADPSNRVIPKQSMQIFYARKVNEPSKRT